MQLDHFSLNPVSGENFFGRKKVLDDILSMLLSGGAVNIYSLRKMGKTSLLFQIAYLVEHDPAWYGFHPVYLDFELLPGKKKLSDYLFKKLDIHPLARDDENPWFTIEDYLAGSNEITLLLMDELGQRLIEQGAALELAPLRALHQRGLLNIVAATPYKSIFEYTKDEHYVGSPLYNIFREMRLPALNAEEGVALVVTLSARGGLEFDPLLARQLVQFVGCSPYFIQQIGKIAYQQISEGGSASFQRITQEWQTSWGAQAVSFIHRQFQEGTLERLHEISGTPREKYIADALTAYGILVKDDQGDLSMAPFLGEIPAYSNHNQNMPEFIEYIQTLASEQNKKTANGEPTEQGKQIYINAGEVTMGDKYTTGQAGVVGPGGHSHDLTFNQVWKQNSQEIDLQALDGELELLRKTLKERAAEPEQDIAVAEVAQAQIAAKEGNGPRALEHLAKAGKWAWHVATEVGIRVAAEALNVALQIR